MLDPTRVAGLIYDLRMASEWYIGLDVTRVDTGGRWSGAGIGFLTYFVGMVQPTATVILTNVIYLSVLVLLCYDVGPAGRPNSRNSQPQHVDYMYKHIHVTHIHILIVRSI